MESSLDCMNLYHLFYYLTAMLYQWIQQLHHYHHHCNHDFSWYCIFVSTNDWHHWCSINSLYTISWYPEFKSPLTLKNCDHHKLQEMMNIVCDTDELISSIHCSTIVRISEGYKEHTLGNLYIYNDFVYLCLFI